jgi:arylsulfatase
MKPSTGDSFWRPATATIVACVLGFALADFAILLFRVPEMLLPSHWEGLAVLAASALVFYLFIGFCYLVFLLVLKVVSGLFRRRPGGRALALGAVVSGPLFLMTVKWLQRHILGTYLSLKSFLFLLPLAIGVVALVLGEGFMLLLFDRLGSGAAGKISRLPRPRLTALSMLVFLAVALLAGPEINVLGVFSEKDQRRVAKERMPENPVPAPPGSPNIVVVAIECLRSDSFSPETAPFLWELSRKSCYFDRYYVAAPATRPSVTSFFTSLYPVQHGCYNMAGGTTAGGGKMVTKVPEDVASLPRILQDHGYRTVMVTSNALTMDHAFGFERNFHRFDAAEPYKFRFPHLEYMNGFRFIRSMLGFFRVFKVLFFSPEHSTTYFDGPRLNKTVFRELERPDKRPFFLYVHYIEPHSPYYLHPYRAFQLNLYIPSKREDVLKAYRSEIRAVDEVVKKLYSYLERKGLLDNTYLFITADHGEEFYDHGNWGHGKTLFPEVLHVPAILVPPPKERKAVKIEEVVDAVDVAPTIVELCGLEAPDSWEGESLLPLIPGRASKLAPGGADRSLTAFSQFDDGHSFLASAVMDSMLVVFRIAGDRKRVMLFDLKADPGAKHDIFATAGDAGRRMAKLLENELELLRERSVSREEGETPDEQLMEQLKTLGYIE